MQDELVSLGQRRIRLMPIFRVRRAHVRLDSRVLLALAKKLLPDHPDVAALKTPPGTSNPQQQQSERGAHTAREMTAVLAMFKRPPRCSKGGKEGSFECDPSIMTDGVAVSFRSRCQ